MPYRKKNVRDTVQIRQEWPAMPNTNWKALATGEEFDCIRVD